MVCLPTFTCGCLVMAIIYGQLYNRPMDPLRIVGIVTGLNDSLYLFGIFLIQLMVNCWFWGLVVWIPRIPRK